MKRIHLVLLTLLLLFIFILYSPIGLYRIPFSNVNALEAISQQSPFFFQLDKPAKAFSNLHQSIYKSSIGKFFLFEKVDNDLKIIEDIFEFEAFSHTNCRITASLQVNASNNLNFLYILDNCEDLDMQRFLDHMVVGQHNKFGYRGCEVYEIKLLDGRQFSLSKYNNLLLLSRYSLLVEDGINQIKSVRTSVHRDNNLQEIIEEKTGDLKLFVNINNLHFLTASSFKSKLKSQLEDWSDWVSWMNITCNFQEDQIVGTTILSGNKPALNNIEIKSSTWEEIGVVLPDDISFAAFLATETLSARRTDNRHFQNYISPWIGEEMAYVIAEPMDNQITSQEFILLKTKDYKTTQKYLDAFTDKVQSANKRNYLNFEIYEYTEGALLDPILGDEIKFEQKPYFVIFENYVLFASSRQGIEIWIDKYTAGRVMATKQDFMAMMENGDPNFNLKLILNHEHILPLIKSVTKPKYHYELQQQYAHLKSLGMFQVEMLTSSRVLAGKFSTQSDAETKFKTSIIWKTNIKGKALTQPYVINNPVDNKKEVWIQDDKFILYRLDAAGKILLTKQLEGPMLSEVYPIDFYRNSELQYIFNTADNIYIIDGIGQDIADYPIPLKSPATNGLTLIDYEGDKAYKMYIACENKNVYGYSKTGNPLPGWNPKTGLGRISYKIQHFQNRRRDFLVLLNDDGKLFAYARNGDKRFSKKLESDYAFSLPDYQSSQDFSRIVTCDESGYVHNVNLFGDSFKLNLPVGERYYTQFCYTDMVGDPRNDYIVMSDSSLACYYYRDTSAFDRAFVYNFRESQDKIFKVEMPRTSKGHFGTLSNSKNRIYLFKEAGALYPDFPLSGSTPFVVEELYNDGKKVLVVGNEKSVYGYRLR